MRKLVPISGNSARQSQPKDEVLYQACLASTAATMPWRGLGLEGRVLGVKASGPPKADPYASGVSQVQYSS